jgi:phage protein U
MLAQIGDFIFEINGTSFESLEYSLSLKFATHERLGNFNTYQDIGKHEEGISIKGTLIVKKQTQLNDFETMAKRKLAVTMVFVNGIAFSVLIFKIKRVMNTFLKDGLFLKQTYTIALQVVDDANL